MAMHVHFSGEYNGGLYSIEWRGVSSIGHTSTKLGVYIPVFHVIRNPGALNLSAVAIDNVSAHGS